LKQSEDQKTLCLIFRRGPGPEVLKISKEPRKLGKEN